MPPTTAEKTWENCLTHISDQISTQSFRTWFAPITPLSLERKDEAVELRLAVPDAFHTEWLESHYAQVIRRAAADVVGRDTAISYEVAPEQIESGSNGRQLHVPDAHQQTMGPPNAKYGHDGAPSQLEGGQYGDQPPSPSLTGVQRHAAPAHAAQHTAHSPERSRHGSPAPDVPHSSRPPGRNINSRLKAEYTFDSFIEGDCNRLARSASVAIAQDPGGTSFNPFMVYGGVGLGKTHIVQAIGNYVNSNLKADRVLYVSSEQFTSQFVRSIQANRVSDFSNFYRQIDLLIVDDVQFFGGKEKTQEEFFHVFNELHQSGKQIILCADRPPAEISGIEERLLSRFKWGLSADIQVPDLETRIAILQYKAAQHNVSLSPDVVDFVAERVKANIRQLEGALLKLSAHSSIYRREIDPEAAKEILRDMMDDFQVRLEIEDIQRAVAQFYSLTPELLSAKTRKREVVTARHIAMYFSKQMTSHSLKSIGLRFGGRDHSTVIHACNSVEDRVKLEPAFREEFTEIEQLLQRQSPPRPARMRRQQVGMA
jgi:chromosomal replication initiator protein